MEEKAAVDVMVSVIVADLFDGGSNKPHDQVAPAWKGFVWVMFLHFFFFIVVHLCFQL